MANPPKDLNDEVVRLYVEERMNVREIAERFRKSYGQIYRILRSRAVMRSERGLHLKIAESIRERIVAGDWTPHKRIPSQIELADTFGVSPQTVGAAAAHLSQRGYLRIIPSRGMYVRLEQYWDQQEETREVN